jgi:hypothetical protein
MKTVVTFLLVALTMIACCGATTSLAAPGQESLTQSNRLAQLRANEGKIILEAPLLTSQLIYESASIGLRHDRYGEPVMIMGDGSRKSMAGSCFQPIRSRICVSTNALDHFSGGRLVRESTRSLSPKVLGVMSGNTVVVQMDDRQRDLTIVTLTSQQAFVAPFRRWEVERVDPEGLLVKVVMGNSTNLARFRFENGEISQRPLRLDAQGHEVPWE